MGAMADVGSLMPRRAISRGRSILITGNDHTCACEITVTNLWHQRLAQAEGENEAHEGRQAATSA